MNKKALSKITNLLVTLVCATLILIVIFGSPLPFIIGGFKSIMGISSNPCQCGHPENGIEQIDHEGAEVCVYAHRSCEGLALEYDIYQTIQYARTTGGETVTRCIYSPSDCDPKEKSRFPALR